MLSTEELSNLNQDMHGSVEMKFAKLEVEFQCVSTIRKVQMQFD